MRRGPLGKMAATHLHSHSLLYLRGSHLATAGDFPPLPPSRGRADRKHHQSTKGYCQIFFEARVVLNESEVLLQPGTVQAWPPPHVPQALSETNSPYKCVFFNFYFFLRESEWHEASWADEDFHVGCGRKAREWPQAVGREALPPAVMQGPNGGLKRSWA